MGQMDKFKIPCWSKDVPEWVGWVQWCSDRGWLFTDDNSAPHIYSDGRMDSVRRFIRSSEVEGVRYRDNYHRGSMRFVGSSRPDWSK